MPPPAVRSSNDGQRGAREAANPPAVAFPNTLDDTNAGITPGYPQKAVLPPVSSRCQRAHQTRSNLWPCTPVPKKLIPPLTSNSEKRYLLE